jgi:hypothetical protein
MVKMSSLISKRKADLSDDLLRRFGYGCAILLLTFSFDGCATSAADDNAVRVGNDLSIYVPFDNSRDWGPSYLVGPPEHHFGYGSRIDDSRSDEPMPPLNPRPPAQSSALAGIP